jgi:hypothetical protein
MTTILRIIDFILDRSDSDNSYMLLPQDEFTVFHEFKGSTIEKVAKSETSCGKMVQRTDYVFERKNRGKERD